MKKREKPDNAHVVVTKKPQVNSQINKTPGVSCTQSSQNFDPYLEPKKSNLYESNEFERSVVVQQRADLPGQEQHCYFQGSFDSRVTLDDGGLSLQNFLPKR